MTAFLLTYGLLFSLVVFFAVVYLPHFRTFPSSDEWTYVAALRRSPWEFFRWVMAQFADHRIPLQKLIQFALLRASGFDFRYLVGLNILLSAVTATLFLETARLARGRRSWGDCLIPLLLLVPASGPTLSGFHFQFLSSVLALGAAVLLALSYIRSGREGHAVAGVVALVVGALCGLNGLLVSTLLLAGTLLGARRGRPAGVRIPTTASRIAAAGLALCVVLWIAWSPSGASQASGFDLSRFLAFAYGLLGSPFVIYSFTGGAWKAGLVLALVVMAALIVLAETVRGRPDAARSVLAIALLAQLALNLGMAAGRATARGGWEPVIGMHYSFLMAPIPVLAWILISRADPPWLTRGLLASLLVLVSATAYIANLQWRSDHLRHSRETQRQLERDLCSGLSDSDVADRYLAEFTWDPTVRTEIRDGLSLLRAKRYSLFRSAARACPSLGLTNPHSSPLPISGR